MDETFIFFGIRQIFFWIQRKKHCNELHHHSKRYLTGANVKALKCSNSSHEQPKEVKNKGTFYVIQTQKLHWQQ